MQSKSKQPNEEAQQEGEDMGAVDKILMQAQQGARVQRGPSMFFFSSLSSSSIMPSLISNFYFVFSLLILYSSRTAWSWSWSWSKPYGTWWWYGRIRSCFTPCWFEEATRGE
jgi:hypothetical protein